MIDLPDEIWLNIYSHLDLISLKVVKQTCRKAHALFWDDEVKFSRWRQKEIQLLKKTNRTPAIKWAIYNENTYILDRIKTTCASDLHTVFTWSIKYDKPTILNKYFLSERSEIEWSMERVFTKMIFCAKILISGLRKSPLMSKTYPLLKDYIRTNYKVTSSNPHLVECKHCNVVHPCPFTVWNDL